MNNESESEWKSKRWPAQAAKQDEWKESEQAIVTNFPTCEQKSNTDDCKQESDIVTKVLVKISLLCWSEVEFQNRLGTPLPSPPPASPAWLHPWYKSQC